MIIRGIKLYSTILFHWMKRSRKRIKLLKTTRRHAAKITDIFNYFPRLPVHSRCITTLLILYNLTNDCIAPQIHLRVNIRLHKFTNLTANIILKQESINNDYGI